MKTTLPKLKTKLFKYYLFSLFITSIFSECTTLHKGYFEHSVILSEPNYIYVKKVSGSSSAFYFLFLGGSGKSNMIEHAKEDLYRNAQLQDNQEIANVTVSETFSTAILFSNKKIEIYADVIEWMVDSTENKPIINRAKSFEKNKTNDDQEKINTINACYSPSSSVLKKYKSDYEIKVGDVVHLTLEKKSRNHNFNKG